MSYRYFEMGYKVVKLGKHTVSCAMGALGGLGLRPFVSGSIAKLATVAATVGILALCAPSKVEAETLNSIVIEGQNAGGFLIDQGMGTLNIGNGDDASLSRYEGGSKTLNTTSNTVTIFTGFDTRGQNGSGGGAGLGGVFFVDQGAVLRLADVVFAGNAVKGGEGGSDPAIRLGNKVLDLQPKSLGLIEISQQLATPYIIKSGGNYVFRDIDVSATGGDLLSIGAPVTFDTLTGKPGAFVSQVQGGSFALVDPSDNTIETVTGDTVRLNDFVQINAADVSTFTFAFDDQDPLDSGDDVKGYSIAASAIDLSTATEAQADAINDEVGIGSVVFVGDTFSAKVTELVYDSETGDLSEIKLDKDPVNAGATGNLDIIALNSFKLKQFNLSGNEVSIASDQRGFEAGMALFDGDGNPLGVEITSVSQDGQSFTVDNAGALDGVNGFEARQSPIVSATEIQVSAGAVENFYVGATVHFADTNETRTVTAVKKPGENGWSGPPTLQLDAGVNENALSTIVADGDALEVELRNVKSASGSSITVQAAGLTLETDMILEGAGIAEGTTISSVGSVDSNGFVTISLSDDVTGDVTAIVAKSALTKGGAMNSLQAAAPGDNGDNGFDSNNFSSFFNSGEGQEGTRGYAGGDGDGGPGGDGGYGGNGSDGMPINPDAIRNLKSTTNQFATATSELIDAISPPVVVGAAVGVPKPSAIVTKSVKFAGKALDFATAIYENVQWGINLSRGIAGMGGEGGEGGEGGGGDEFFGAFTDGGNGGNGGRGGNGGFGAGGGSGGAGGDEGATGAADGGDGGEGGFGGFAAGDGSNGNGLFGGGGSGFGGAIFVRETGTLQIRQSAHFLNNVARGGSSNNQGAAGDGAGAAIFMMKGSEVTLAPSVGKEIIFDDDIADNSAATYEGAPFAEGDGADLIIHGDGGVVRLNAENTYTGNTIIRGSTLDAELGVGVHDSSRLVFDGNGTVGGAALGLDSVGTLLLQEDLTGRRVGNSDSEIKWSGSGGFASGIAEGVVVNLGERLPGLGQTLTWGSDGFFENLEDGDVIKDANAPTSTLTFGSNQSVGSVEFVNNVSTVGILARVAVYNTGTDSASSTAILSGNWSGPELWIGDATTDYTGALYMTGQNSLDRVQVLGGAVSTFNAADPSTSGKLFAAGADIRVGEGSALELYGTEDVNVVTVDAAATAGDPAGALRLYGAMSAATVTNSGILQVDSGTDIAGTSDGNGGMLKTAGSLDVSGTLANVSSARIIQNGDISADTEVINDGDWSVAGSSELEITNGALGATDAGLTGAGSFCLETAGADIDACNGLASGPDVDAVATTLTLNQAGDSTFDGVFAGLGALVKTGAGTLTLTNAQTFLGGLTVNDGVIATGTNSSPATIGTFADTLAITVNTNGQLDVNNPDTFGSLTNFGIVNVNADQTVVTVDNKAEANAGEGDGLINLRADMTATGDFKNDGVVAVRDGNRTLNVATLTGAGAFDGDADGTPRDLTINQSDTSTYAGSVTGVDDFVKTGAGTLTLTGTNAYGGTGLVQAGTLIIGTPDAMDVGNDYIVSDQATLRINSSTGLVTGDQVTVNDRGILDVDSEFKATLLSNSGLSTLDAVLEISTYLNNTATGRVDANADVTARNLDNDGLWNVLSSRTLTLNGTGTGAAGLTGAGSFCLETAGADIDACNGLASGPDVDAVATTLALNQAGDSTFDGEFAGLGALVKTGAGTLTLTNAQTFLGGLTVNDGVIATGTNSAPATIGTFADTLAITVNTNGQLDVNNPDTFGSLTNFGIVNVNADQNMVTSQIRGGTLNINANLTTSGAFSVNDEGSDPGIVNVNGSHTITADGGLAGNGDIRVNDGHNLTLSQKTGTISTFRGTITSDPDMVSNTSRFTLDGGGELILAGSTNQVSLGFLDIVDGRVVLDGSELLADTIAVDVAVSGQLELRDALDEAVRQESIKSLGGSGKIYLGRNTLNVVEGGSFQGEFFGTGSVNVEDGTFTINKSLTSSDGSLMVSNAGGTTVSQGTIVSVNSVQVMDGALMNVAGTGTGTTEISRVTTNDMIVQTNSTLHMGTGSYSPDAETFSVIEADNILINGQFAGNGTMVAPVINITAAASAPRANITPGDSPGVQMYMGGQTTFGSNSTLEIEVLDRTIGAGIGFDQVRFMAGGLVTLEGDSLLSVVDLASHSGTSFNTANYNLGELVKFADFDPLSITGQFGSVQHTALGTNPNDLVVNLATGTLVGIGTFNLDDAASNANQQAMLDGLRVSSAGGVDQFYGGQFVENLTSAWSNNEDLDAVFERASPEVYAGLGASAQAAALNAGPKWFEDFVGARGKQGAFLDFSTTSFAADDKSGAQMAFGVDTTNVTIGFNRAMSDDVSLMLSLGTANTDLNSDYLNGSGDGLTAGMGLVGKFPNSDLAWQAGMRYSSLSNDGTRVSNNGSVSFGNVDTTALQFNLGVEYHSEWDRSDLGLRANLVFGTTSSDGFSETNLAFNPLDAMAVNEIEDDYARLELGARLGTKMSDATRLFGELDLSIPLGNSVNGVVASYDGGQGALDVKARGLDTANVGLSVGVEQKISDTGVATLSVGGGNSWGNETDFRASLSTRFQF